MTQDEDLASQGDDFEGDDERWNRLAPEAIKLGLKVKVHTSPFESRALWRRRGQNCFVTIASRLSGTDSGKPSFD